jgi:hypothetical protein
MSDSVYLGTPMPVDPVMQPALSYQAGGHSFVWSRRLIVASQFETPIALFRATTKTLCWNSRNSFCWAMNQFLVLSAYADPTVTDYGQTKVPLNLRIGSANLATAIASADPTVSNFGGYVASLKVQSATPASSSLLVLADPGHSILVTATASVDGVDIGCGFSWFEMDL